MELIVTDRETGEVKTVQQAIQDVFKADPKYTHTNRPHASSKQLRRLNKPTNNK